MGATQQERATVVKESLAPPSGAEAPGGRRRAVSYWLAVVAVSAALLLSYQKIEQRFPWYFMWDIDLTTTADVLLLLDGRIPGSFAHPARGMYPPQALAVMASKWMGGVSVAGISDLQRAIHPFWAASEVTVLLRALSPFVALGLVLTLWAAALHGRRVPNWIRLLLLVTVGSMPCLPFNVASIRSELYCVVYWFLAFLLLVLAFAARSRWLHCGLGVAAGIALGLSFLTKTQSVALVVFFALFAVTIHELRRDEGETPIAPVEKRMALMIALHAVANLVVFLTLFYLSKRVEIPGQYATFASFGGTTIIGKLFVGGFSFLALVAGMTASGLRAGARMRGVIVCLNCCATGFLVSYLSLFLFAEHWRIGRSHLAYTFKAQYWGRSTLADASNLQSMGDLLRYPYMEKAHRLADRHGIALAFFLLSGVLLPCLRAFGWVRARWSAIVCLTSAYGLLLASFVLTNRLANKDDIFFHPFAMGMVCFVTALAVDRYTGPRTSIFRGGVAAALVLLLGWQCGEFRTAIHRETADNWILSKSYDEERFFRGVFLAQGPYAEAVDGRIPGKRNLARQNTDRVGLFRKVASVSFPGQTIRTTGLGAAYPAFFIWSHEPQSRFVEVPRPLTGALVVDPSGFVAKDGRLAIHSRRDLATFALMSAPDAAKLKLPPSGTEWTPHVVRVDRAGSPQDYQALLLQPGIRSLPVENFTEPYFFLLIPR